MKKAYMLSLGLLVAGCNSTPTIQPSTGASSASLNSVVEHTTESIKDIKRDASGILTETKTARSAKTNSLDKIDSKATNIIESADDLNLEIQKLKKLTVEVDTLEKSLSNLEILMEQTRAKAMEKLYGYISMFWVIGFLLIAGGAAVAFFLNKTYGGSLALIGLLMLGFASAQPHSYLPLCRVTLLAQFAAIVKSCSDVFYIPNDRSGVANTKDVIFTAN